MEVCDSPAPLRVASRPGTMADLHCSATGKIFLTYLYPQRLVEFIEVFKPEIRTPRTLTTLEQLQQMIEEVQEKGFAWDDEEYHPGIRCMAAPVFNMERELVAAIGITGPAEIMGRPEGFTKAREAVCKAAARLSSALGYKQ